MAVEAQSEERQNNADQANKHVKQASLNLDDIKGTVLIQATKLSMKLS